MNFKRHASLKLIPFSASDLKTLLQKNGFRAAATSFQNFLQQLVFKSEEAISIGAFRRKCARLSVEILRFSFGWQFPF